MCMMSWRKKGWDYEKRKNAMTTMNRYRYFFALLFVAVLAHMLPSAVQAQSVVNMINGDSIVLDACVLGGGTIYDDGGADGLGSAHG